MRRETVQGPVKKLQPDGLSHKGGGSCRCRMCPLVLIFVRRRVERMRLPMFVGFIRTLTERSSESVLVFGKACQGTRSGTPQEPAPVRSHRMARRPKGALQGGGVCAAAPSIVVWAGMGGGGGGAMTDKRGSRFAGCYCQSNALPVGSVREGKGGQGVSGAV